LGDVALLNDVDGLPQGLALDIAQAAPIEGYNYHITGSDKFAAMQWADVVIVAGHFEARMGWNLEDILEVNAAMMASVGAAIRRYAPNSFVIRQHIPGTRGPHEDITTLMLQRESGRPVRKVVGVSGTLYSQRFRTLLAEELSVSVKDVSALIFGGHWSSTDCVALIRHSGVAGITLPELVKMGWIKMGRIEALLDEAYNSQYQISKLLDRDYRYCAAASTVVAIAESYLKDKKRVLICTTRLSGEYGIKNLYIRVPTVIGDGGVEKVVEVRLNAKEKRAMARTAKSANWNAKLFEKVQRREGTWIELVDLIRERGLLT